MQVRSLGPEDSLEEEMATLYSCLENHMDRGAWQATRSYLHKASDLACMHTQPGHWDF